MICQLLINQLYGYPVTNNVPYANKTLESTSRNHNSFKSKSDIHHYSIVCENNL